MTYVVWHPESWTLKIGRAWAWSRVQRWLDRGWYPIVCQRGTDASWEREALRVLRRIFPAAFASWADAEDVLGPGGKGYSECFTVEPEDLNSALAACIRGFARGTDVHQATNDQPRRLRDAGRSAGRREAVGGVAVAEPRPARPGAVRHEGDLVGDVSDARPDTGRGRRAPGAAGGGRVPDDVPRPGPGHPGD
ncbi:unnamed protein product, partial [Penicillium discolor]